MLQYIVPVIAAIPQIPMAGTGKADFNRFFEIIDAGTKDRHDSSVPGEETAADLDLSIQKIWREALGVNKYLASR